ncbi:MAG: hypothetical protein K5776_13150 [Lachnospiraceae bacterium]|nr:hypothetical protein [Lachnospiraceae bacterium]
MPHSSGGGSHGGGSHHSSHHSSRSYHSSGSSGPSTRASSRPFKGATRYVYYSRQKPVFVYANYNIQRKDTTGTKITALIFLLITTALSMIAVGWLFTDTPKKLQTDGLDTNIYITDNANVIDNDAELMATLEDFYYKTGVIPAVLTVHNEDWEGNYQDFENFAYDAYVNSFDDESHWLIAYSEPVDPDPKFNDWYWEGMQGDDTDNPLFGYITSEFTTTLHKNFLRENKMSRGDAIINAFETISPMLMKRHANIWIILFCDAFILFISGVFILGLDINPRRDKGYSTAVPCPDTFVDQEACDYCGGIYVVGFHDKCPHCSAPVKPHDFTVNENGETTSIIN